MVKKLHDKVALVTGGSSGIGLATAKEFAHEGAQVVVTGRDQSLLDQAIVEIGAGAVGIQGDVSRMEDLDRLFSEIRTRFGRIDVLFANAGVASVIPFDEVTDSQFDREFDINVRGLFFTVQKALPLLSDGASIILTSSIAGLLGTAGMSIYSATKAAVRSFARTLTSELKGRGIRVNSLSPGPTETPIAGKMGLSPKMVEEMGAFIVSQVPMARQGKAEETAKAALFLASSDSSFVTGIDLCVDGGMSHV
jgi:NAD(P)-dependent dehydrogenase (short-subunit alcohol dehydrogenase family)